MYLPNPCVIGAIKASAYCVLGAAIRMRAGKQTHPVSAAIVFGVTRAFAGWLVGVPVLLAAAFVFSELSNAAVIAVLALPRFALSALLIRRFFDPRGGRAETMGWAAASVALASILDWVLLENVENSEWLRIAWC